MVVFSLLLEKCGEEYYYRYISENISYYIPDYKTQRLNKTVNYFERLEEYTYAGNLQDFLNTTYEKGEYTETYTIKDIKNSKDLVVVINGYKYNNYIIIVGLYDSDNLLDNTLFKEDYIFLVKWVNSKDEIIEDISDNVTSLLGYTKNELLTKPYIELIHPEDRNHFKEEFSSFIAQESKSFYQKYRLINKEGKSITVLDHSCQVTKDEKKAIVGYLRDITVEVEMTSQIKELIDLDEANFNNSILIRIEWDENYDITRWNNEAISSFGWDENIIGSNVRDIDLFNSSDSLKMQGQFKRLFSREVDSVISTFRIQKKDGSLIDTKWGNRLIIRAGQPRILSSVIDQSQETILNSRLTEMEGRTDLLLKTLSETKLSNDVFAKLIHNPLTANPEGLIKAEIIIRKLEEEITRLNNTIFYNNDNNLLNDVAFLKNEDHIMREKLSKVEEDNEKLSNQLKELLNINILTVFKNLDIKNFTLITIMCYLIFGQFLPSIYPKIIRPAINSINKELKQVGGKD